MTHDEAEALLSDPHHFTKAVTDLGDQQPLLTTRAIFNEQGVKVAEKGVAVTSHMYERLMQHRLSAPLQDSVAGSHSVDADHLRETAEVQLLQVPLLARVAQGGKQRAQLLDTVARVPLPAPMAFQLTLASELRPESFHAAVRSAMLAAWLSTDATALRFDVGMAAAAGLLHDVGMLHLDPVLQRPAHGLSGAQQRQLHSHPLVSTLLLQRHHEYAKEVARAVTEHHEQVNGAGYPRALAGEQISPLGRALALAEVVAALLAPHQQAAQLRLSVLLRMNAHRFDAQMTARVMALLRPQDDATAAPGLLLPDPVALLCAVDDALAAWPGLLSGLPGLTPDQARDLVSLAEQVAQLRRTLANVGAAREQLVMLGPEATGGPPTDAGDDAAAPADTRANVDAALHLELSLLAREAGWQLRAITRQARRRWRDDGAQACPGALRDWLEQAEGALGMGPQAVTDVASTGVVHDSQPAALTSA